MNDHARPFALVPGIAIALGGIAPSAAAAPPDSPILDEIVVTADRQHSFSADLVQAGSFRGARQLETPLTISVMPDALLRSQQARGLLDALRNSAGVSPSQSTTTVYSNVAIRGISVENRSNYRLNGILPIVNLVDLPLEDKDRVEVLKGASALYYGFTTPGGIVNLTMRRPPVEPYFAATLFGNDFGAIAGHVDAGDTWGRFGARLNAVYGSVDPGLDNTRGHRSLLAVALDYRPADSVRFTLDAEHILKRMNEPGVFRYAQLPAPTVADPYPRLELPPLLDPVTNFGPDWASNRAEELNWLTTFNWHISPAWALSASAGNSHLVRDRHNNTIDLDNYGPDTNGDGTLTIGQQPGATFENSNFRIEIAGAVNLGFMKHEVLLGASQNIRDSFNSTNVPANCPGPVPAAPRVNCRQNIFDPVDIPETVMPARTGTRARIDDIGYYLFDRIEMSNWLQLFAGARRSDYTEKSLDTGIVSFHDTPTSVSYGVVVKPRQWMSVYGTYIEGLESTPLTPINAANAGEQLPAADSSQQEAGIKLEPRPGLLLQAAYFDIERSSAYVNAANVYVRDGRARFQGAELSATGELTADWSLYVTAQFLDARQKSGAPTLVTTNPTTGVVTVVPTVVGRKIENTPERTFSFASEYRLSRILPGLSVNAGAYYLGERAVNAFNQAWIPGYTLFNLGAAYSGKYGGQEFTFRLNAQNVANKRYFSSTGLNLVAQGPPREIRFALSTQF